MSSRQCYRYTTDASCAGVKRAKLEVEASPKKRVVSARRKKNLSLLPTVPFDVLMEVRILYFRHLCISATRTGASTAESRGHHCLITHFKGIQGTSPVEAVAFGVEGRAGR